MNREAWQETVRRLSLDEFRLLHEVVAEEYHAREAEHLAKLRVGDWVEFEDRHGRTVRGTVRRINRRTVEVTTDGHGTEEGHHHWRVSATLIRRVLEGEPAPPALPAGD